MFTSGVEFGHIEINAILIVGIWILLNILTIYAAVVCAGVFKTHCINADRVWKKHYCRACTALSVVLPVLSVLKTVELACLATCG